MKKVNTKQCIEFAFKKLNKREQNAIVRSLKKIKENKGKHTEYETKTWLKLILTTHKLEHTANRIIELINKLPEK